MQEMEKGTVQERWIFRSIPTIPFCCSLFVQPGKPSQIRWSCSTWIWSTKEKADSRKSIGTWVRKHKSATHPTSMLVAQLVRNIWQGTLLNHHRTLGWKRPSWCLYSGLPSLNNLWETPSHWMWGVFRCASSSTPLPVNRSVGPRPCG